MRFLIDAQLPPALARVTTAEGFEAVHVYDIGLASATDAVIWQYAVEHGAAIITKDDDFVSLRTLRSDGPAVVWIRIGNTGRRALLEWFVPLLPKIAAALDQGETLIEVAPG